MAMIHTREFDAILTPGGVNVLASYGFFARQGNQVESEQVRNLLSKLDELKPLRQSFTPLALAQFLGVPCNAILNLFCRAAKGVDKYGVEINSYDAHKMLASFLSPKQ